MTSVSSSSRTPAAPFSPVAQHRWQGIDVLRGLSILAVVLLHIDGRIPFAKSLLGKHLPHTVSRVLFRNGYYGVKVFFVISGFLITANILRRWGSLPSVDIRAFYRMRFARIMPCLLGLIAVLGVLHGLNADGFVINPQRASLGRAIFAALTFHLNVLEIHAGYLPANWDVLWSLSVEEVFYLAYPLICRFCRNRWILAALALGLVAAGPLARTSWAGANELAQDKGYFTGFDCIALGCATALLARVARLSGRQRRIIFWVGLFLILEADIYPIIPGLQLWRAGLDVTVLAAGAALILLALRPDSEYRIWVRPFLWFGRNSYEIYLTHSFVVVLGAQAFQAFGSNVRMAPVWQLSMIAASGVFGWAVARYYSEPLNRYLRGAAIRRELSVDSAQALSR